MTELSSRNFGLAIAYFIPGFVALWGLSEACAPVETWLTGGPTGAPTLGGVALASFASIALGMTVSAVRWASIDQLHHRTGLRPPRLDFRKLPDRLDAFYALVENHYRYYQFYSNMAVATAFAAIVMLVDGARWPAWVGVAVLVLEAIFLASSRDALSRYYERSSMLLGERERKVLHDERVPSRRVARSQDAEEVGQTRGDRQGADGGGPQAVCKASDGEDLNRP